jgi:chromosome segregation ATPase
MNALQKQLDVTSKRLKESTMSRNQLLVDIEHKNRECKFVETRCDELQQDRERHRQERGHRQEASGGAPAPRAAAGPQQQAQTQELQQSQEDLQAALEELRRREGDLEEAARRNAMLEEALSLVDAGEGEGEGPADWLCALAGLRGEVAALKNDLLEKRSRLRAMEAERGSLSESNRQLQQQAEALQARLQAHLLQPPPPQGEALLLQLSQAEGERDVLLEYVQDELRSTAELTQAADTASREAAEARRAMDSAREQLTRQEQLVDAQATRIKDLEGRQAGLAAEGAAALAEAAAGHREVEEITARLARKELETKEMGKVHISLLEQVFRYYDAYIYIYIYIIVDQLIELLLN